MFGNLDGSIFHHDTRIQDAYKALSQLSALRDDGEDVESQWVELRDRRSCTRVNVVTGMVVCTQLEQWLEGEGAAEEGATDDTGESTGEMIDVRAELRVGLFTV